MCIRDSCNRRHWQDSKDHPFRPRILRIHSDNHYILIGNIFEAVPDLSRSQFFSVFKIFAWFFEFDFELFLIAIRTGLYFTGFLICFVDKVIGHMSDFLNTGKLIQKFLFLYRFKQKLAAFSTGCSKEFSDNFEMCIRDRP